MQGIGETGEAAQRRDRIANECADGWEGYGKAVSSMDDGNGGIFHDVCRIIIRCIRASRGESYFADFCSNVAEY